VATSAFWKWATVVGLSMTPALVLGQSAAATAGIAWGLEPRILIPVMAFSGFVEGVIIAWLGGTSTKIGTVQRFCDRLRKPKAVLFAQRWGRWGGMTLGVAVLGQEPILLALRFLGIDLKKLVLPIAVSNIVFAFVYYGVVKLGLNQIESLKL
jgi:hypothetical protein